MHSSEKLFALTAVVLLTLSVFGPGVAAAQGAANESVAVETGAATDVTTDDATLHGNLTELEGADTATVWFEYWVEGDPANTSTTGNLTLDEPDSFRIDAVGLASNTTYVFVAHAETDTAAAVGSERTFTTDVETSVSVDTRAATDVTNDSATLNGNLTELEGADTATVWFEYWQQGDPANATNTTDLTLDGPSTFSASVTGLQNNTTYVYVAHAEANNTTVAGDQVTFTTREAPVPLGVTTLAATDVDDDSATLNGELTGLGDEDTATVWFEYWEQGDPANATNTTALTLDAPGTFSASVTDLQSNTTYVYVAHAAANGTEVTGAQVTFTTAVEEPPEAPEAPDAFGQRVSAFVHELLDDRPHDKPFGQLVSGFVTANNPGAAQRPDHAGPPAHAGPKDDGERGPPAHAGPPDKGDSERGPPDHAGPPDKDDEDDEDDG